MQALLPEIKLSKDNESFLPQEILPVLSKGYQIAQAGCVSL